LTRCGRSVIPGVPHFTRTGTPRCPPYRATTWAGNAERRVQPMIVELKDGSCRTCGCTLRVIDADDVTMTVSCIECRDTYAVEPDAFNDGGENYHVEFLAKLLRQKRKGARP